MWLGKGAWDTDSTLCLENQRQWWPQESVRSHNDWDENQGLMVKAATGNQIHGSVRKWHVGGNRIALNSWVPGGSYSPFSKFYMIKAFCFLDCTVIPVQSKLLNQTYNCVHSAQQSRTKHISSRAVNYTETWSLTSFSKFPKTKHKHLKVLICFLNSQ